MKGENGKYGADTGLYWGGLRLAAVWAGLAGATALLMLDPGAPAPRWDVVGCVAVAVLGLLAHRQQAAAVRRRAVRPSPPPIPAHPPRALRLAAAWPLANHRFLTRLTGAAVVVPLVLAGGWVLASAGETGAPGTGELLGSGLVLLAWAAVWMWGARRVGAEEAAYVGRLVEGAAATGTARVLRVAVAGWAGGVHQRHPEGALPTAEVARRKGRPFGPNFARLRVPRRHYALRLTVPGAGERLLYLDHGAHAEGLATALQGWQGLLYWVPSGVPGAPTWTAPAVLVLGDGQYVQGWTQNFPGPGVPDGPEAGSLTLSPVVAELRPPALPVLRQVPAARSLLALPVLALLLVLSVLLGLWDGLAEAALLPLAAAPALCAVASVLAGMSRWLVLTRLARAQPAPAPARPPASPPPPPAVR